MRIDKLFDDERELIHNFDFGQKTVDVFDDMLDRSVPFYGEIQRMIAEICADFAVEGTNLYDIGCSTGNTFLAIEKQLPQEVTCIGLDASQQMLEKAEEKLSQGQFKRRYVLRCQDINAGITLVNASVVIMNLTLQFVRPLYREKVVESIAQGLNPGGCLILVEKVLSENSTVNRLFIQYYYDMKRRNGYSELEIAQKREALENVLVPYHFEENRALLLDGGFRGCDCFFRWYNFCGLLAVK